MNLWGHEEVFLLKSLNGSVGGWSEGEALPFLHQPWPFPPFTSSTYQGKSKGKKFPLISLVPG